MKFLLLYGGWHRTLIGAGVLFVSTACANGRADAIDRLANRPDLHEDYAIFALRCSKCHSLDRPLNSGITDDNHWDQYVARMRRQPGSGINLADSAAILRFLHAYSAEERRRQQSAVEPNPAGHPEDGGPPQ